MDGITFIIACYCSKSAAYGGDLHIHGYNCNKIIHTAQDHVSETILSALIHTHTHRHLYRQL